MRVTYSKDADILYISFTPSTGKVASVENANGDIMRIDTSTGKIVGVTIQCSCIELGLGKRSKFLRLVFRAQT